MNQVRDIKEKGMGKIRYAVLFIIPALLLSSCVQLDYVDMVPLESGNTEVVVDEDLEYLSSISSSGFEIAMVALPNEDTDLIEVSVALENPTAEDIDFSLGCFELYSGNADTGEWFRIEQYEDEGGSFFLPFLSFLVNPFGTVASAVYSSAYNALAPNINEFTAELQSEMATALSSLIPSIPFTIEGEEIQLTPYERKFGFSRERLEDVNIEAGTAARGLIVIEPEKKSPDYRIVFTCDKGAEKEFIFQRSDRDSILNPWLDQHRDRFAITLAHAVNDDRFALASTISRYRRLGAYMGLSFNGFIKTGGIMPAGAEYFVRDGFGNVDIDYSFADRLNLAEDTSYEFHGDATGKTLRKTVGISIGFAVNPLPYTTFLLGPEAFIDMETYTEADLSYRPHGGGDITSYNGGPVWLSSGQALGIGINAGATFITNFLAFNMMFTYRIPDTFYFDIGAGVAF